MRLIISCHGCSESTESPSISLHADRKDLGMDNQGATVRFSVARRFRNVLYSQNSRESLKWFNIYTFTRSTNVGVYR